MKHKTFRGKTVDMEAIRRQHEHTIAAGNMSVNAKGDKLGPGGTIVETTQARARKHYTSTTTSQSKQSIKGDQSAEKIFEEEKTKVAGDKSKGKHNTDINTSPKKRKKVERETESGDIFLEEAPHVPEDSE